MEVKENAWWTMPGNFDGPLGMSIKEDLEEHILAMETYLRCIVPQVHSNTLIQLERWLIASGQNGPQVGPFRDNQWLMRMIQSMSQEAYYQVRVGGTLEMEVHGVTENAWWTVPENFDAPLVMLIDEGQEEHIFGHGDLYLRHIEVHSNTLIQLERWFTPSGQTRVTVVGPLRAKQWLRDMIQSLGSQEAYQQFRGQEMLQHVQNQLLTNVDLEASFSVQASILGLLFKVLFVL